MGAVYDTPNNYNKMSKITDPRSPYKYNNENVWNISRITKMWHRDMKWANAVGKMAPLDLLDKKETFNL